MLLRWLRLPARWLQVVEDTLRNPAGALLPLALLLLHLHLLLPSRCSPPPPAALPCNHLPPSHRLPWDRTEEADAARNSLEWRNIFEQLGEVGVLRRPSTIQQLRNIGGKTEDNHFLMD